MTNGGDVGRPGPASSGLSPRISAKSEVGVFRCAAPCQILPSPVWTWGILVWRAAPWLCLGVVGRPCPAGLCQICRATWHSCQDRTRQDSVIPELALMNFSSQGGQQGDVSDLPGTLQRDWGGSGSDWIPPGSEHPRNFAKSEMATKTRRPIRPIRLRPIRLRPIRLRLRLRLRLNRSGEAGRAAGGARFVYT